jgi:drug/metabolite transporter (DMT)-like permease
MRSILIILFGAACYGIISIFVKLAYKEGFSLNQVVGCQVIIGFIMMLILWFLLYIFKSGLALKGSIRSFIILLPIGITVGGTSIFNYSALQYIPASLAIVLLFQFVWIGVLIEAILIRKLPGKDKIMALALVLVGTVMAGGLLDGELGNFKWMGVVFGLLSAISYALFIAFSGKASVDVHPITKSTIMVFGSMVMVLIVYPPTFIMDGSLTHGLFKWGFLIALFGVIIPPICLAIGTPKIGGALASILSSVELPVVIIMSSFVLKEQISVIQWFGVIVILLGVALPELFFGRKNLKESGY